MLFLKHAKVTWFFSPVSSQSALVPGLCPEKAVQTLSLQTGTQTHTHNTLAHIHTGQIHLKRSNPLTVGFRGALCTSVLQTYDSLCCQLPALCANDDIEHQQFSVKMYEMQKKMSNIKKRLLIHKYMQSPQHRSHFKPFILVTSEKVYSRETGRLVYANLRVAVTHNFLCLRI